MAGSSTHRNTGVSRYLQDISEFPILTKDDEAELLRRLQSPDAGRSTYYDLVKSNLSFVVKIACEYRNRGLPFEDLVNEGNLGAIEAAQHFDPSRGTRFITYAVWWIRKSMLKALAQQAALVHVPTYQLRRLRDIDRTGRLLSRRLGREADRGEISAELQLTLAKIDEILQAKTREMSLDETFGGDENSPVSDYLADERSVSPEDEMIGQECRELVRWALGRLSELERFVIVNRFGLSGGRVLTLREVGDQIGVSRERIRQLETQALKRLQKAIALRLRPGVVKRGAPWRGTNGRAWRGVPLPHASAAGAGSH
jgi:RNA polymerase primary sigma factor